MMKRTPWRQEKRRKATSLENPDKGSRKEVLMKSEALL
jgi:hypothetical protein